MTDISDPLNDEPTALETLTAALRKGEKVTHLVVGNWGHSNEKPSDEVNSPTPRFPNALKGKPITLTEAKPFLNNWSIVGGFGVAGGYALFVFTETRILFTHEYDGRTGLRWVPRNPVDIMPEMSGMSVDD